MILKSGLQNFRLLLGSGSPRRRELLAGCGLEFEVVRYDVDETYPAAMPAEQVAPYLAARKSDRFPRLLDSSELLITADTVVILDGQVLGKPADEAEAIQMLTALSGRQHSVISGVVIRTAEHKREFAATTEVWFRSLSREEIEYYVSTCRPLDKAGAYGIQEWIGYIAVERINGSFYNVMGLPIEQLWMELGKI